MGFCFQQKMLWKKINMKNCVLLNALTSLHSINNGDQVSCIFTLTFSLISFLRKDHQIKYEIAFTKYDNIHFYINLKMAKCDYDIVAIY